MSQQSIDASITASITASSGSITVPATYRYEAPDPDVMVIFRASLALAAARANALDWWCVPPLTSPPASPVARTYVPPPARWGKKHRAVAPKHTTTNDHPACCDDIEDPRAPEAWDPCG